MLQSLLRRVSPGRPPPEGWFTAADAALGSAGLSLRYLGTAGFVLEAAGHSIALDPYLSRHDLGALFGGPLRSDTAALAATRSCSGAPMAASISDPGWYSSTKRTAFVHAARLGFMNARLSRSPRRTSPTTSSSKSPKVGKRWPAQ